MYHKIMNKLLLIGIVYLAVTALPAMAQTATPTPFVFTQGYYEFESHISDVTYVGTWITEYSNAVTYRRSNNAASTMSFWARGKYVLIYRLAAPSLSGSVSVCVSGNCVSTESYLPVGAILPILIALPSNMANYQVVISFSAQPQYFDALMILDEAAIMLPTPTEITFPTGVPTWTPAPSPTPIGVIFAIDPSAKYGMHEGQITKFEYSSEVADLVIFAVLTMLLVSMWGMFFFYLFRLRKVA